MSGTYKVVLEGLHCSFDARIDVIVYKAATIVLNPKLKKNQEVMTVKATKTLMLTVVVTSGYPALKVILKGITFGGNLFFRII